MIPEGVHAGVLTLIVLLGVLHPSVALAESSRTVSSLSALQERAKKMCEAWVSDDLRAAYQLTTPDLRRCMTYEQWVKEWRSSGDGQVVSCKAARARHIDRGELAGAKSKCSDDPLLFADAAVIKVRLKLKFPDGTTDVVDDMLNGWLNVDGVWYWHDWTSPSMD